MAPRTFALAVALLLAVASFAQTPQTCFTPPADSPILAPTLDTIPPSTFSIITYTGARADAPANGRLAVVEVNDNEQKVWFSPGTWPGAGRVYYNRRHRANASSPWYWQYNKSIQIMNVGNASVAVSSVLYSATPRYRDHSDPAHGYFKYVMYLVTQPHGCDGQVAGFLHVAFSNDGICWSGYRPALRLDGPSFNCFAESGVVPVETIAAIDDGASTIYFLEMEGNLALLVDPAAMNGTSAYLSSASVLDPATLTKLDYAEVSNEGIVSPESPDTAGDYFKPYNYFINLDMAWDATDGTMYVGRTYPFPFDRQLTQNTPCPWQANPVELWDPVRQAASEVEGCSPAPSTYPNRLQIYKKQIGSLMNIRYLYGGPWTLVSDLGGDVGYTNGALSGGNCSIAPNAPRTDARQQNVGRDFGYINFVRDPRGYLKVSNGVPYVLAGDDFKKSKSVGECYITGEERQTLMSFPR